MYLHFYSFSETPTIGCILYAQIEETLWETEASGLHEKSGINMISFITSQHHFTSVVWMFLWRRID